VSKSGFITVSQFCAQLDHSHSLLLEPGLHPCDDLTLSIPLGMSRFRDERRESNAFELGKPVRRLCSRYKSTSKDISIAASYLHLCSKLYGVMEYKPIDAIFDELIEAVSFHMSGSILNSATMRLTTRIQAHKQVNRTRTCPLPSSGGRSLTSSSAMKSPGLTNLFAKIRTTVDITL
jgi:hypothetical protein